LTLFGTYRDAPACRLLGENREWPADASGKADDSNAYWPATFAVMHNAGSIGTASISVVCTLRSFCCCVIATIVMKKRSVEIIRTYSQEAALFAAWLRG
jgi:hypothetical protein